MCASLHMQTWWGGGLNMVGGAYTGSARFALALCVWMCPLTRPFHFGGKKKMSFLITMSSDIESFVNILLIVCVMLGGLFWDVSHLKPRYCLRYAVYIDERILCVLSLHVRAGGHILTARLCDIPAHKHACMHVCNTKSSSVPVDTKPDPPLLPRGRGGGG